MRKSLISEIKDASDVTNVFILTHNIDFIFLQSILLRTLRKIGHPKLTIFADEQCARESFAHQHKIIDSIGIRYRVVPVMMQQGYRFHPKAIFLSSPDKGILYIGSGNLTFGGWYENAEIWCRIDTDSDGTAAFSAFKIYLEHVISLVPFSDVLFSELGEAYDTNTKGWAESLEKPDGLIGKVNSGENLIQQIHTNLIGKEVRELIICSPYFDSEAKALKNLVEKFGNISAKVLVQKSHSGLAKSAASTLNKNIKVVPIKFYRENDEGNIRESFIHSKFYAFDHGNSATLYVGSANCSNAALSIPGKAGNAELMAVQNIDKDNFQEQFIKEFELLEGDADLTDYVEDQPCDPQDNNKISILAARYEAEDLFIGFSCSDEIYIKRCIVDDVEVDFEAIKKGEILAKLDRPGRYIRLDGVQNNEPVTSNLFWVDREVELRTPARGRSLVDTIRSKILSDYWHLGAWAEILDVFFKHLQYMPSGSVTNLHPIKKEKKPKAVTYAEEDVFAADYGLPTSNTGLRQNGFDTKIASFQQLMLKWFGYSPIDEDTDNGDLIDGDDDESEKPLLGIRNPKKKPKRKPEKPLERERKKTKIIAEKLADTICCRKYLEYRPPELIASDLKLMAVLLLTGLREEWITYETFFEVTRKIWSNLFFTSEINQNKGWLEYRYQKTESPERFVERMTSTELSATLFVWSLTVPFDFTDNNNAIFTFSCLFSVSRHPWLWHGGSCSDIGKVLETNFSKYAYFRDSFKNFEKRWLKIIRLGHVIRKLENEIENRSVVSLKRLIKSKIVFEGDLLWQGPIGFCIATKKYFRDWATNAKVLCLHDDLKEYELRTESLIPVRALMDNEIIPTNQNFNELHKRYLKALIKMIREQYSG